MKYLVALLVVVSVAACSKQAESTQTVGVNGDYQVGKLFTVDGCTVYRFTDGGYSRYFTNCNGSTQWNENCGKNCSRPMSVN